MNWNKNSKFLIVSLTCFFLFSLTHCQKDSISNNTNSPNFPYIIDMVHNNPAEEPTQSIYNDPEFLIERGYNGMVTQWHIQCGITYDSFEKGIIPEGSIGRNITMESISGI